MDTWEILYKTKRETDHIVFGEFLFKKNRDVFIWMSGFLTLDLMLSTAKRPTCTRVVRRPRAALNYFVETNLGSMGIYRRQLALNSLVRCFFTHVFVPGAVIPSFTPWSPNPFKELLCSCSADNYAQKLICKSKSICELEKMTLWWHLTTRLLFQFCWLKNSTVREQFLVNDTRVCHGNKCL